MQDNLDNSESVTRSMEEFRVAIRDQLEEALAKSTVNVDNAYENFHKTVEENPQAVVLINAKQVHQYIIVLNELGDFLEEEWEKRGQHSPITKKETAKSQHKHELDHAEVLWRHGKRVDNFGVLMCRFSDGLPQGIPFINHEEVDGDIKREMILAPDEQSPGDIKKLAE